VVHIYCCRTGYRRYRCTFSPSKTYSEGPREVQLAEAAQDFATHLETMIKRHPYQWANFYDLWEVQAAKPTA